MGNIQKNCIYPKKIKKTVEKGFSRSKFDNRYEYELVKVYKNCALYQNSKVNDIRESLTIFDIKYNPRIEVLTDKEYFENFYFDDIWE